MAVHSYSGNKVDHYYEVFPDERDVVFKWSGHCSGEKVIGRFEHPSETFSYELSIALAYRGLQWLLRQEGHRKNG